MCVCVLEREKAQAGIMCSWATPLNFSRHALSLSSMLGAPAYLCSYLFILSCSSFDV